MTGGVHYAELATAAVCLIVFGLAGSLAGWATTGLLTFVLALLVAWEIGAERYWARS